MPGTRRRKPARLQECGLACEKAADGSNPAQEEACPAADEAWRAPRMKAEGRGPDAFEERAGRPQDKPEQDARPRTTPRTRQAKAARRAKVIATPEGRAATRPPSTSRLPSRSLATTLAVDMDPQGNLTMSQGVDPDKVEKSMFDVLVHRIPLREVIVEREIDVAVASIDLAGAEIAMSAQIGRAFPAEGDRRGARRLRLHLHRHRPAWGCSRSTRSPLPTRSSSRCSASTSRCAAWCSCRTRCR